MSDDNKSRGGSVGACAHPVVLPGIGDFYDPARTVWPEGGAYWVGPDDRHRLIISLPDLADDERHSIAATAGRIGVATSGPAMFCLWRFWRFDWADCPYSVHLQTPAPVLSESLGRLVLDLVLIEARTGRIATTRAVELAADVSQAIRTALRAQAAMAFDEPSFDSAIQRVYAQYEPAGLADRSLTCEIPPVDDR